MPITGIFNADFSDFYTAVEQAKIKLVDFESEAADVSKSLNKVNESLSGRKIMQDAAEITRVIENMGGVAHLTANEIGAIGPKVNEAVAKLKLMGQAVPESMQKLADETKNATTNFNGLASVASGVAGGFGIAMGLEAATSAVIEFGKQTIATAAEIVQLADRLGITTEQVQKLTFIAQDGGTSIDAMANAAEKLRANFKDPKVQQAIRDLGLSVDQLKSSNPYDLLHSIGGALAEIGDKSKQADAAKALFKNWNEILPALVSDWEKLGAAAGASGEAQVRALKAASDELKKFQTQFTNEAIQSMGDLLLALEQISDPSKWKDNAFAFIAGSIDGPEGVVAALARLKQGVAAVKPDINLPVDLTPLQQYRGELGKLQTQFGTLSEAEKITIQEALALGQSATDIAGGLQKDVGQVSAYVESLKKAQAEAKKLADAQVELNSAGGTWQETLAAMDQDLVATLTHYAEAGVSAQTLALAFGATDTQVKAVNESIKEQKKMLDDFDKDVIKTRELWIQLGQTQMDRSGTATDKLVADIERWFNSEVAKLKESDLNYRAHYTALAAIANEKLSGIMVNWDQLKGASLASLQDTAARAEATWAEAAAHMDQYSVDTVEALRKQADAAQEAVNNWNLVGAAAQGAGDKAKKAHDDAADAAKKHQAEVNALTGTYAILNQTADQWLAKATALEADAARNMASGAGGMFFSSHQIGQDQLAQAQRDRARAGQQQNLDTLIGSMNANAGAWGGGNYRSGWTVNVNGVVNGDQIANELVSGMRRRGVSPGAA
jgi:hypothetical protein